MQPQQRVAAALATLGLDATTSTVPAPASTADDAAHALGCVPGQVIKTLLFMADGRPTVVLVPGGRVASPGALARLLGVPRKRLKMGTPGEVLEHTGYAVGAVAPVGIPGRHDVIIDRAFEAHDDVWAAAGVEDALFRVDVRALAEALGAQWADISEPAPQPGERS